MPLLQFYLGVPTGSNLGLCRNLRPLVGWSGFTGTDDDVEPQEDLGPQLLGGLMSLRLPGA